ncbi:MAG: hypothetical protein KGI25_09820 [Thaumarchaeota archaeon]|nr:hypothetical protein [Nitrososphaerota archaeon]
MARPKQIQEKPQQPPTPKKKLTLNEFRAWLSGVEEMQESDWTPSASQWRTIRAKIEEVIDVPAPRQRYEEEDLEERRPRGPIRAAGPSAFSAPAAGQMIQSPTSLSVEQSLVSAPNEATPGGVKSGGLKIKTPNIDTSKGGYVAAFE